MPTTLAIPPSWRWTYRRAARVVVASDDDDDDDDDDDVDRAAARATTAGGASIGVRWQLPLGPPPAPEMCR